MSRAVRIAIRDSMVVLVSGHRAARGSAGKTDSEQCARRTSGKPAFRVASNPGETDHESRNHQCDRTEALERGARAANPLEEMGTVPESPVILWNLIAIMINFLSVGAYIYFVRRERSKAIA